MKISAVFFIHICIVFLFSPCINPALSADSSTDKPDMIYIPEGEFSMGSVETDGEVGMTIGVDEFPKHEVYLNSFYIDRLETTNSEYADFIKATGNKLPANETHPYDPYIWKDNTYPPGAEKKPVVLIDWFDANNYCKWRGKRLLSEEEWEKAARGTDRRLYPWGNIFDKMRANNHDLRLNMSVTVGSFPGGVSPYGVYDMSGNVWEWTSSWYKAYPGSNLQRPGFGETDKVVRGGAWLHPADIYGRTAERTAYPIKYKHRTVGVRCAKEEAKK